MWGVNEKAGGTTNCYDGNIWDNSFCPDPATCNANCEMGIVTIIAIAWRDDEDDDDDDGDGDGHIDVPPEGCESGDWSSTYGVSASGTGAVLPS